MPKHFTFVINPTVEIYIYKLTLKLTTIFLIHYFPLKNDVHPVTGVPYDKDGFPIFEPVAEVKIDKSLYLQKDTAQFKKATELLQQEINKNTELKKHFTEMQLKQISKGKKPKGFTWHHHQNEGIMQLVDADIHGKTGHTGGRNIWGGGSKYR